MSTNIIYEENEKYINSSIIHQMVIDELKMFRSFNEVMEFISGCKIYITEEQIKEYLDSKMDEEKPTLRKEIEEISKPYPKNIAEVTEEDIDRAAREFGISLLRKRYEFEPYSLKYFKTYTSILKSKCKKLFTIVNDLEKLKSGNVSEE